MKAPRTAFVVWPMRKAAETGSVPLFLIATFVVVVLFPIWYIPAFLLAFYDLAESIVNLTNARNHSELDQDKV